MTTQANNADMPTDLGIGGGMVGMLEYIENVHFICPMSVAAMIPAAISVLAFPGTVADGPPVFMSVARATAFLDSTRHMLRVAETRQARELDDIQHQRALQLAGATRANSGSPPPQTVNVVPTDEEPKVAAFKDGLAALTHLPGTIGFGHVGKEGNTLRHNAMVSTDFASKYRKYVTNRAAILEKLSPAQRSFAANPPIDISTLPTWAQVAIADRFEVDFSDLRTNYMQAFLFQRVQLVFSFDSVAASIKKGHCIGLAFEQAGARRPRE